jgi:hypothetical protein
VQPQNLHYTRIVPQYEPSKIHYFPQQTAMYEGEELARAFGNLKLLPIVLTFGFHNRGHGSRGKRLELSCL